MHAILHSFVYPLKRLTQASISIQPIPILHTTHNNVLPYSGVSLLEFLPASIPPGVSLLEFLSTAIPSGCLTPGILLHRHYIRMSHVRNPSAPPFPRGVSLPEFLSVAIPSGCLTPGTLLGRLSTFPGYLASGILSGRRSTFFSLLRAFP